MDYLNNNFLYELFRLCFLKKSIVEKVSEHLKFQYLPSEELKIVYKCINNYYSLNNQPPTFGVLYEINKDNEKVVACLNKIKESDISDPNPLLKQLEKFIKDAKFQFLWDKVVDIHRKGDRDGAIKLMAEESSEINNFTIYKDDSRFKRVFEDFSKVQLEKQLTKEREIGISKEKIPFGILPCDILSEGGMDRKETLLWIMRSGVGKSTVLKWQGMYACRLGYDVLHIQLEGSEEEAFDKYTQIWSAQRYGKIKSGDIESDNYNKLLSIAKEMVGMNQDIYIKSFEQFDESTMLDVRDTVVEYIKEKGKAPDLLVLDSMDLCHPGDGVKYGVDTQSIKMKLQNSSRKFNNICNEFDMRGITATQTSDVPKAVWNDPGQVITRSDSMGDKNIANSYNYVFTGNQTLDEEKLRVMRIYFDKCRYYSQVSRVYPIATNFELGRFFDMQRTNIMFKDIYNE